MADNINYNAKGGFRLHNLAVCSYNCRGYNTNKNVFICYLLDGCDLLRSQEHWLSDSQLPILAGLNNEFLCTGVSAFNNYEILAGRLFTRGVWMCYPLAFHS